MESITEEKKLLRNNPNIVFAKWLPIVDWEGYYEISDLGRVKSLARIVIHKNGKAMHHKERILKTGINSDGYKCAGLSKNGKQINPTVHKLVGLHFVKGYAPGLEVNHIDGNKLNNAATNLEWGTHLHNMTHAIKTGLFIPIKVTKEQSLKALESAMVIRSKAVINIISGEKYKSIREAARHIGMQSATLSSRLRGKLNNNTNIRYDG